MIEGQVWYLKQLPDETFTLFAPGGRPLFNVSLETLHFLGMMFLETVEDAEELEDLREALYERP